LNSATKKKDVAAKKKKDDTEPFKTESNSRSKKKKVVVSQELLDVDGCPSTQKKTPLFFILEDDQQVKDSSAQKAIQPPSLISILEPENTTEESNQSPLISVVEDEMIRSSLPDDGCEKRRISLAEPKATRPLIVEQEEDKPLWTEVTTRRRQLGPFQEPLDKWNEADSTAVEQSVKSTETTSLFDPVPKHSSDDTSQDKSSLFKFQQDLESLVWQQQQQNDPSFAKDWSPAQVAWAWQWVLGGKRTKRAHHRALGQSLFQCHPVSIVSVLQPQTQEERVVALYAVQLIQDYLPSQQQEQSHLSIGKWATNVMTALLLLVEQPRRTLLAQESWKSAVCILSSLCERICSDPSKQTGDWIHLIPEMMGQLERILQVQLSWKRSKKSSKKNQVMVSILQDWRRTNQTCQNKMLAIIWCEQMAGHNTQACSHWGGLRQTLCGELTSSTTTMTMVEDTMTSCWQEVSCIDDPCEFLKRSVLRGVLATVATTKGINNGQEQMVETSLRLLSKSKASETIDLILSLL
jgi:hypothetical protein